MADYYAYFIGIDGHMSKRFPIVCDDDEEVKGLFVVALTHARAQLVAIGNHNPPCVLIPDFRCPD
jgi:hypothetical protein